MSSPTFAVGTEIAPSPTSISCSVAASLTSNSTLLDLLDIVRHLGDKNLPMLRSTVARISEFKNDSADHLAIDVLVDLPIPFRAYLKERRYSQNSIRTYCQNSQRLLRWAKERGWESSKKSIEQLWQPIVSALNGYSRSCKQIITHAIQNAKAPAEFSSSDLDSFGDVLQRAGRQHRTVRLAKWHFRRAIKQTGVEHLLPNFQSRSGKGIYRVRASEMPDPLRKEVEELLAWKQARFAKGRPQWTRHRPVSAKQLENNICRLFGFATKIAYFEGVQSLGTLFTEPVVSAFIEWGLNERGMTRSSLLRLSMLYGAMRHHPKYKNSDYRWFTTLFDQVPQDDESRVQEKKARKAVPFQELRRIPALIRSERARFCFTSQRHSRSVHDELLIMWLTTLAWRQRNLRECRIGDPETANVFKAPLPQFVHVARPAWAEEVWSRDPQASFWQFYFRENETKTGQKVRGILPRRLIPLLEEYLANHRPRLVAGLDPGTLFLNADGHQIDYQIMTYHISEIVLRHTGRRMTPHLFRDAFAYAYLAEHPEDFLTLSKILWHANVQYTLGVYGRNFDESNGARRVDEWLGSADDQRTTGGSEVQTTTLH